MTTDEEISPAVLNVLTLWTSRIAEIFGADASQEALERWALDPERKTGVHFAYDNRAQPVILFTEDGAVRMAGNVMPQTDKLRLFVEQKKVERARALN